MVSLKPVAGLTPQSETAGRREVTSMATRNRLHLHQAFLICILAWLACGPAKAQSPRQFEVTETTIAKTQAAIRAGRVTCRQLVEAYLKRISAYDQPTGLNAIVVVNPKALAEADRLDREFKRTGKLRPLHGIAVIVKDNYDTNDLQTTGGSLALKNFIPAEDA